MDAWTEPLTAYAELYTQGLISTAWLGLTGTEIDGLMAEGKLGIYGSGPWDVATIQAENPSLKMLMGPAPGPAAGQGYWCGSPNVAWAINAKAKNPAAAYAFLGLSREPCRAGAVHRQAGLPLRHIRLHSQTAELLVPSCSACSQQLVLLSTPHPGPMWLQPSCHNSSPSCRPI